MRPPKLDVPRLLHKYRLKPNKELGQNFLIDPAALERIIAAADLSESDEVLEIGAGVGSLTRYLCRMVSRVIAIEIDHKLIPLLKETLTHHTNVNIIQGDILSLQLSDLVQGDDYKVVANIPYYITSKLIRYLLESGKAPCLIVLTIQREVAMRICAQQGKLSLLALSIQVYGQPQICTSIPAGAFYPVPKVDSAVVRIDIYDQPVLPSEQIETFFQIAQAGFSQKRKTIRNSLSTGLHIPANKTKALINSAGIDPQRRAETLNLSEWQRLIEVFESEL
jgi:16S rRNA (adenine1518-N6/adenine1519-N6)-dimethyltransferase